MTSLYPTHHVSISALAAAAQLYHFASVPLAEARVLEIGCAQGIMSIGYALAWPQSRVVGIDIDEDAIAKGQKTLAQLGLTNSELYCAGLPDLLTSELGQFDYIVIRGLFSLMGQVERRALLDWCHEHLSDPGLIGFYWHTLPGSREAKVLQDAIGFHSGCARDEAAQLASARGMLSYLAMTLPEGALKCQVQNAEQQGDLGLALRYLNNFNEANYLVDFYQQISDAGLDYVGDSVPQYELAHYYNATISTLHKVIVTDDDPIKAQQYLDFAIDRSERFSLLGKAERVSQPRKPDLNTLDKMHWAGNFKRRYDEKSGVFNGHSLPDGAGIYTGDHTTLLVLDVLGAVWPLSLSFEQLLFHTTLPEKSEDARAALLSSLNDLFIKKIDGLFYSASPGAYNGAASDALQAIASFSSVNVAEQDPLEIVNFWGQVVVLSQDEYAYLQRGMTTGHQQDWLLFTSLRNKGLITGSPLAWQKKLQQFLHAADVTQLLTLFPSLLIISSSSRMGGFMPASSISETVSDSDKYDWLYEKINQLNAEGLYAESRRVIDELLQRDPENIHLLRLQSRTSLSMGAWHESMLFIGRLLSWQAQNWDIWFDLATACYKTGNLLAAESIVRALLRIDNKNAGCWNLLACLFHVRRQMTLAEKCARESLRYDATVPYYLAIMGIILSDNQKLTEARYFLEKAQKLNALDFDSCTSLLFVLTHDHTVSASELFKKHLEYGQQVSNWAEQKALTLPHNNVKNPHKKLRIGFVSGDFRQHPVAYFLKPFWDNIDREKFELVGYSALDNEDDTTAHFASTAALWQRVATLNYVELAKRVNQDNIDILIDLSGHTTGTRLPTFAFKPAPVQMTWMGYPGTSGIPAVDYRITSTGFAKPGEMDDQYTEKLIYVPMHCFFEPNPLSPAINRLPALSNGYITYGSLNRPSKINDAVFELWAKILSYNNQAKMLIGFMADEGMIAQYRKKMIALGVGNEQLIFRKTTGLESYLALHHEIDILLDTFPYSGGTTTNHGIWMGVPTLTLAGETPSARQGVETLNLYGLSEFIAADKAEYFAKAVAWQGNIERLNALRQGMRQTTPATKQTDFNAAASFEKALRQAWHIYCAGEAARSFSVAE